MPPRTSFTHALTLPQQDRLIALLRAGNYRPATVPHARAAADGDGVRIVLYESGKCVAQGRGAADFVLYVLEPEVLGQATLGYEDTLRPEAKAPHMGVDESGKGDFFGPLVTAAAYIDPDLGAAMEALEVRDSKKIGSDAKAIRIAQELRKLLGHRFALVVIGPQTYNRLYMRIRNVNQMLAWAHARAIENLLERVPDCPRAVSDQFGRKDQVERALMQRGRAIVLEQRPKAESDLAVAAASILARAEFLRALEAGGKAAGVPFPKGASAAVREAAVQLVRASGPGALLRHAKCHFQTTDAVLASVGQTRAALGPEGQAVSRAHTAP